MKLQIKSLLCLTIIATAFSTSTRYLSAQYSVLKLSPTQKPKQVKLPFAYKHLSNDELKNTAWVPERFYTTLGTGGNYTHAVIGHLCPCILVALRNDVNGRIVIFHKSFTNSIENLIYLATRELDISDAAQIRGLLFTNGFPGYETEYQETIHGRKTFKELFNGRTQREELRFIKDTLIRAFSISDRNQIDAQIFDNKTLGDLGDYEFARLSVLIDENFTPHSICMMHEHIMGNFDHHPVEDRIYAFGEEHLNRSLQVLGNRFPDLKPETANIYNNTRFEKIG